MKQHTSKSGITFSELGYGAMNMPLEKDISESILNFCLEHDITYIDTADLYQKGQNEKMVGQFIKSRDRGQLTIGSKVGNEFNTENDEVKWNPSKAHITKSIHESLGRLNTGQLDLYMLHGGTIEDNMDETIEAFEMLKSEGLIKAYGISSIRPNVIDYYLKNSSIDVIMMQFNPLDNRPFELIDKINEKDVQLLTRGPLMKGLFSADYERIINEKFEDGFMNFYSREELQTTFSQLSEVLESQQIYFTHHAYQPDLSMLSYLYLMQFPVASIVNGASKLEQVQSNLNQYEIAAFVNEQMPEVKAFLLEEIKRIFKTLQYEDHRI